MSIEDDIAWVKANAGKLVRVKSDSFVGQTGKIVGYRNKDGYALINGGSLGDGNKRDSDLYTMVVVGELCKGWRIEPRNLEILPDPKINRALKMKQIKDLEDVLAIPGLTDKTLIERLEAAIEEIELSRDDEMFNLKIKFGDKTKTIMVGQ